MHAKNILPALFAISVVTATAIKGDPVTYYGTYANFVAQSTENNTNVGTALFDGCTEFDGGTIVSSGAVCVARILSCMLEAVATVVDDTAKVATINSTTNAVSNSSGSKATLRPRKANMPSMGRNVRVTDIVPSDVHPRDGVAYQMNVRTDDTILNVHRNGSHLVARFDPSGSVSSRKRDSFDTGGSHFEFVKVAGIKVQAQGSTTGDNYRELIPDLTAFSYAFAYNGGHTDGGWRLGDVFEVSACRTNGVRRLALKIIPELYRFSTVYESMNPPECS